MANLGQELASLDFDNLIGGPLNAIVQAQAKSAIATANFVSEVGFDKNGDVRNTTFRYTRANAAGDPEEFKLDVPFIAMLPIPYVQIEEGEVEFNAKLTSQQETTTSSELAGSASLDATIGTWFVKAKVKASMSMKKSSSSTDKVERSYDMRVRVRVRGTDLPSGTERILNILENSLAETPTGYLGGGTFKVTEAASLDGSGTSNTVKLNLGKTALKTGDELILATKATSGGERIRLKVTSDVAEGADTSAIADVPVQVPSDFKETVEAGARVEWRPVKPS